MAERPKGIPMITDASTKRVKIALLAAICSAAAVFCPIWAVSARADAAALKSNAARQGIYTAGPEYPDGQPPDNNRQDTESGESWAGNSGEAVPNGRWEDGEENKNDSETDTGASEAVYTDSQGITYILDGNACYVSGYTEGIRSSAVIPQRLEAGGSSYTVNGIRPQAFSKCSRLKKIEIPNSVADVGNGLFSGCRNLSCLSIVPAKYGIRKNGKTSIADIRVNSALLRASGNVRLKIHKGLAAEAAAQKGTDTVSISVRPDSSGGPSASLEWLEFDAAAAGMLSGCGKALKVKLSDTDGETSYVLLDKSRLKHAGGSLKLKLRKQPAGSVSGKLKTDLQKALKKNGIPQQKALVCPVTLAGVEKAGMGLVLPVRKTMNAGSKVYVYRYSKSRRDFLTVLYRPASVSRQGNLRLSLDKGGIYILSAEPFRHMCRKLAGTWITESGSRYYLGRDGQPACGWKKLGQNYYYFDRENGKMASGCTVDGIRLARNGQAEAADAGIQKIQTMIKARDIVLQVTKPEDSLEQKLEKCFRWIFPFPYRQYRSLTPIYRQAGWEVTFANDIFDRHGGCCVSGASAAAFLFHECGCRTVYVATDTSHAWVELNGRVYDPLFAESRGFHNYYNRPYEGYGMYAVVKHRI